MKMSTTPESSEVIAFPAPPKQETKPSSSGGYAAVRYNALKHGVLSQHTVLAHECREEFSELLAALVQEHLPDGPTETHLVEELAGIIWRKRRVLQAEGASINRGLLAVAKSRQDRPLDLDGPARAAVPFELQMKDTRLNHPAELAELIRLTPEEARARAAEADQELDGTLAAAALLRRGGVRAYDRALRALTPGSAAAWIDAVEGGEFPATAVGLKKHIDEFLLPYCRQTVLDAHHHDVIKAQTLGEG